MSPSRLVRLFIFAASATLFFATAQLTSASTLPSAQLNRESVGLHSGPDWSYHVVGKVFFHQELTVHARSRDHQWFYVTSDSENGWLAANDVNIASETNSLPIWDQAMNDAEVKPTAIIAQGTVAIHSGPGWTFNNIGHLYEGQEVILLGRTSDNQWLFIWSNNGDGWIPFGSTRDTQASDLPIWDTAMDGAYFKETATVLQRLGMHTGPAHGYNVIGMVYPGQEVVPMARDASGEWIFIWSDAGDAWVPASGLDMTGFVVSDLPIWTTPMNNAELKPTGIPIGNPTTIHQGAGFEYAVIGEIPNTTEPILLARNADTSWLFVWSDYGDGWVSAENLSTTADLNDLPVWNSPMGAAP